MAEQMRALRGRGELLARVGALEEERDRAAAAGQRRVDDLRAEAEAALRTATAETEAAKSAKHVAEVGRADTERARQVLVEELRGLEAELAAARSASLRHGHEKAAAESRQATAEGRADSLERQLSGLQQQLSDAMQETGDLRQRQKQLESDLSERRAAEDALSGRLRALQQDAAVTAERLLAAEQRASEADVRFGREREAGEAARQRASKAEAEANALRREAEAAAGASKAAELRAGAAEGEVRAAASDVDGLRRERDAAAAAQKLAEGRADAAAAAQKHAEARAEDAEKSGRELQRSSAAAAAAAADADAARRRAEDAEAAARRERDAAVAAREAADARAGSAAEAAAAALKEAEEQRRARSAAEEMRLAEESELLLRSPTLRLAEQAQQVEEATADLRRDLSAQQQRAEAAEEQAADLRAELSRLRLQAEATASAHAEEKASLERRAERLAADVSALRSAAQADSLRGEAAEMLAADRDAAQREASVQRLRADAQEERARQLQSEVSGLAMDAHKNKLRAEGAELRAAEAERRCAEQLRKAGDLEVELASQAGSLRRLKTAEAAAEEGDAMRATAERKARALQQELEDAERARLDQQRRLGTLQQQKGRTDAAVRQLQGEVAHLQEALDKVRVEGPRVQQLEGELAALQGRFVQSRPRPEMKDACVGGWERDHVAAAVGVMEGCRSLIASAHRRGSVPHYDSDSSGWCTDQSASGWFVDQTRNYGSNSPSDAAGPSPILSSESPDMAVGIRTEPAHRRTPPPLELFSPSSQAPAGTRAERAAALAAAASPTDGSEPSPARRDFSTPVALHVSARSGSAPSTVKHIVSGHLEDESRRFSGGAAERRISATMPVDSPPPSPSRRQTLGQTESLLHAAAGAVREMEETPASESEGEGEGEGEEDIQRLESPKAPVIDKLFERSDQHPSSPVASHPSRRRSDDAASRKSLVVFRFGDAESEDEEAHNTTRPASPPGTLRETVTSPATAAPPRGRTLSITVTAPDSDD
eukprot:TRINITY_DN2908_c0_g1_i2.p1 TRINITY_DN2908_c0_g1~~TRINITY_DN2908_c0_g1_i2.p1  ORF type:complete len:1141 (+),score=435.36 TRINITY_DN2908_c0_g1_i2:407-3424(+)